MSAPPIDLEASREETVSRLSEAYATDVLELGDFEARVEQAEQATTPQQLTALLADLPQAAPARTAALVRAGAATALVRAEDVPESRSLVTVFGNATRNRAWTVPRRLRVISVFGGTDLDFREAQLAPGVTEIHVTSFFAGVRMIVPPELPVEVDGTGVLGAFDDRCAQHPGNEAAPCRLRVTGLAVLSGVEIEDRHPGETRRQARRRRKKVQRALAAGNKDRLLSRGRS